MKVEMTHIAALLSMLHEPADSHSALRQFRGEPVLRWTLNRLKGATSIDTTTVLCWDDQVGTVAVAIAAFDDRIVEIESLGPRRPMPAMDAITAARRWADGWRGGLLGSCELDLGFDASAAEKIAANRDADSILLVDPAAALIDPQLVEDLLAHANDHPESELIFSPAAPGLSAILLRRALVDRLAVAKIHPGRLLTYWPDQHGVDPIGRPGCAAVPTIVARTTSRFKLDSTRQIARIDAATCDLNGQLIRIDAEGLVSRSTAANDDLPRDVVLELNTHRLSGPIYWPGRSLPIDRPDLDPQTGKTLFQELAELDDIRLTLAGIGDPLLAPGLFDIIAAAKDAAIAAINLETDLLTTDPTILESLATCGIDVISVHIPAATAKTYATVMDTNGFARAMENLRLLELAVQKTGRGVPLIAPHFTKTSANLAEMDCWYDYWIRRAGHAVIVGPSDCAGQIPDTAIADMAPPRRRPCGRLASRITILSDGRVVSCEQDILGKQTMGRVGETSLKQIWSERFAAMRSCHIAQQWDKHSLCKTCRDWHRP